MKEASRSKCNRKIERKMENRLLMGRAKHQFKMTKSLMCISHRAKRPHFHLNSMNNKHNPWAERTAEQMNSVYLLFVQLCSRKREGIYNLFVTLVLTVSPQ